MNAAKQIGEIIMKIVFIGLAALAVATPVLAESWNAYSRTDSTLYMADVDSITQADGVTSMTSATVPKTGAAGDYSHTVETYQFQCAAKKWRTAGLVEYGPDGTETGNYPEVDAAWEPLRPNTNPEQLLGMACEGTRAAPPVWPSVKAYVDAGRP